MVGELLVERNKNLISKQSELLFAQKFIAVIRIEDYHFHYYFCRIVFLILKIFTFAI